MRILACCLVTAFLLLAGCGDEEGYPPVLTDISYGSKSYQLGFNDGQATLAGRVSFEDPDGDVVLLRVTWQDCGRGPVKVIDSVQKDLQKLTSGSIAFITVVSTDCPLGEYAVEVSVSDGRGNESNVLDAVYEIYL